MPSSWTSRPASSGSWRPAFTSATISSGRPIPRPSTRAGLIRGYNGLYRLGLDGSVRLVESGDRYIDAFALSPDGRKLRALCDRRLRARRAPRSADADGRNARTLLTIDDPTREFAMGDFRVVSWPSFDGLEIGGYEIRPAGFDPKKRYPMLVDVHGGGPGSRLYLMGGVVGTTSRRHLWAAMGYVVFVPGLPVRRALRSRRHRKDARQELLASPT